MNIIYGDIMEKWCKENDFSITELINGAYEWAEECGVYGVRDFEYKTGRGDETVFFDLVKPVVYIVTTKRGEYVGRWTKGTPWEFGDNAFPAIRDLQTPLYRFRAKGEEQ